MKRNGNWLKRLDDGLEHLIFEVLLATPLRVLAVVTLAGALVTSTLAPVASQDEAVNQIKAATEDVVTQDMVKRYLQDRPWLDDIPMNPTPENPCHAYIFTSDGRQGIYITLLSRYRQEIELFYYKMRGTDQIEIYLPDSKKKAVGSIAVSEVSQGQFDIKLALGNDPKAGGAADYFSFKQWDKGADASALASELFPQE